MRVSFSDQGVARVVRADSDRPFRLGRGHRGHTHTIAVTSGKGGVGKTQISANLAVSMAQQGRRVLLVDADLGLASLDLALGVRPSADLMHVLRGEAELEEILVEGVCGVMLLPACPGRYEMANLGIAARERVLNMVDELATGFDVMIIDTAAGIGSNAVAFASSADEVLLVATPDPTSLRDAYATAKVLNRRSGVDHIHVVANQVESELDGLSVFERLDGIVRQFLSLRMSYLGCVPRDETVVRAVASGEPYVVGAPGSAAAEATERLVRRLGHFASSEELC